MCTILAQRSLADAGSVMLAPRRARPAGAIRPNTTPRKAGRAMSLAPPQAVAGAVRTHALGECCVGDGHAEGADCLRRWCARRRTGVRVVVEFPPWVSRLIPVVVDRLGQRRHQRCVGPLGVDVGQAPTRIATRSHPVGPLGGPHVLAPARGHSAAPCRVESRCDDCEEATSPNRPSSGDNS
jgi:hypothetical protein